MVNLCGFRISRAMTGMIAPGASDWNIPSSRRGMLWWKQFAFQQNRSTALKTAAYPTGYYAGKGAMKPPQTVGEMSMRQTGAGSISASLISARLMTADFTGGGDFSGSGALVIGMGLALTGAGDIDATIIGRIAMSADFSGSGDLAADISAFGNMGLSVSGSGSFQAGISGIGSMSLNIVVTGEALSTANVAAAVWGASAAANNTAGTMGAALNAAGSAGDPWSTVLPGSYSGSQAGALFGTMVTTTNEMHERDGLKAGVPVLITPTGLTSANISQTYATAGDDTTVSRV
jgi:hypothetical protein